MEWRNLLIKKPSFKNMWCFATCFDRSLDSLRSLEMTTTVHTLHRLPGGSFNNEAEGTPAAFGGLEPETIFKSDNTGIPKYYVFVHIGIISKKI
mgnify:CR=1 FL=1